MRDRGKLTRALVVAAALGVAAFVVSRRLVGRPAAAPEVPADVRAGVEEGIAIGANGRGRASEPEWIPVAAPAEVAEEGSAETLPDAGIAAPA